MRRMGTKAGRWVVAGFLSAVVAGTVWAVATRSNEKDSRPIPAIRDGTQGLGGRLVPVVVEGPAPSDELAAEDAVADARAVTVAFHALLDVAPRFHFAYEGLERSGDRWRVRFVQWTPFSAKERSLRRMELVVETAAARVEAEAIGALRSRDRLRDDRKDAPRSERRRLKGLEAMLERRAERLAAKLDELQTRLAGVEDRVRSLRVRQPSYDVLVTVVEQDVIAVDDVATDSPFATALAGAIGYAERSDGVDAWGADYYVPKVRRHDADTVRVSMLSFWTGPLGSTYEEQCRPEVRARTGKVVHRRPWPDHPPGVSEPWEGAPEDEDGRDGTMVSFGVRYRGDPDDLSLRMRCRWRAR